MFHAIKGKDILWLPLSYYLYQTIWPLTHTILHTLLHEKTEQVWSNVIQIIHPTWILVYSVAYYPISIACLFILIASTLFIKNYSASITRAFFVSIFFIFIFNILFLFITTLFDSSYKELFNWILGNRDENTLAGLYGYICGSIVFMLLYIPLLKLLDRKRLKVE